MTTWLPQRGPALASLQNALSELVDDLGATQAATAVGVSSDTIRRRVRGDLPWSLEEVIDLARLEMERGHHPAIARALVSMVSSKPNEEAHPLLLPTNLRQVLRLVGQMTTEIANTLEDGRVDRDEAKRLLELIDALDQLTASLRVDLAAVVDPG